MDYVPAHGNTNNLADRDNISGARVFDGEDQGNYLSQPRKGIFTFFGTCLTERVGYGNRFRIQQLQQEDWI